MEVIKKNVILPLLFLIISTTLIFAFAAPAFSSDDGSRVESETLAHNEGIYNYYVPYFNSMTGATDSYWTGVGMTNCGDKETTVELAVYSEDGTELAKEVSSIKANGQEAKAVGAQLDACGWMKINSNQPLAGLSFVGTAEVMAGSSLISELYTNLRVPHIAQDMQAWDTTIMICNPHDTDTTLLITYFKGDGSEEVSSSRTISANGCGAYPLGELFSEVTFLSGSIEINASQGVAAFSLYEGMKASYKYFSGTNAVPSSLTLLKKYKGTLTVLQKDAYGDVAGRSSDLWPPHTTTVFKWDLGEEVQLNHGTAPDEVDASGTLMLVEAKTYTFTGTKIQMEALQAAYIKAIMDDDTDKFLNVAEGETTLEKDFLAGFRDYIADDANGLVCTGSVTKEELIAFLEAGEFKSFGAALPNCNWGQSEWTVAFESALEDVIDELGHDLKDYHVCNDDAELQVGLIENYIATGEIEVPEKVKNGPMFFYKLN